MNDFYFMLVGFFAGAIGTLIGAGGGFVLAPLFIFLFPDMPPARLTSISLLAVTANSWSGTVGNLVRKTIHWPSALLFSAVAAPGVIIGVWFSQSIPRSAFEISFALFLLALSMFVLARSFLGKPTVPQSEAVFWRTKNKVVGAMSSFVIGIISSLLGIGGGIIHVPLLTEYMRYPIHLATGTSQAILAFTSLIAVSDHWRRGTLENLDGWVPYLVIGLVMGAQLGSALSKKIKGHFIMRILGVALLIVGTRLLLKNS